MTEAARPSEEAVTRVRTVVVFHPRVWLLVGEAAWQMLLLQRSRNGNRRLAIVVCPVPVTNLLQRVETILIDDL